MFQSIVAPFSVESTVHAFGLSGEGHCYLPNRCIVWFGLINVFAFWSFGHWLDECSNCYFNLPLAILLFACPFVSRQNKMKMALMTIMSCPTSSLFLRQTYCSLLIVRWQRWEEGVHACVAQTLAGPSGTSEQMT